MEISRAMVVGAGSMGAGIAQLFAQCGIPAILADINEEAASRTIEGLGTRLGRRVAQGKMRADEMKDILSRICPAAGCGAAAEADFVLEAVFEEMYVKKKVFAELDGFAPPGAIFATNTSSLPVTEIASAVSRPERVVGMHFFNPPLVMKLVEIMPGAATAPETVERTRELAVRMGKEPVIVRFDSSAGIASRTLAGMLNEAVEVLAAGLASAEDIDKAMKAGAGLPMGPLELIDLIGVDIHLAKSETLYREIGDLRYKPNLLLEKMVRAGHLGRKAGRGFFTYNE